MPIESSKPIVVTDLDGTLLDHHTYSYEPADALLAELRRLGIAVIANTSKTRAEWIRMAAEIGNEDAFVVENGSAIHFPDGECVVFGETRQRILEVLQDLRGKYAFEGYANWDIDGVMEKTGLSSEVLAEVLGHILMKGHKPGEADWWGKPSSKVLLPGLGF